MLITIISRRRLDNFSSPYKEGNLRRMIDHARKELDALKEEEKRRRRRRRNGMKNECRRMSVSRSFVSAEPRSWLWSTTVPHSRSSAISYNLLGFMHAFDLLLISTQAM